MTLASLLFGFVLSTLYGAVFHLGRGGNFYRLILYLVLAWVGFWVGQILAGMFGLTFLSIGQLHIGFATITSFLTLFIGYWLSLVPKKNQ